MANLIKELTARITDARMTQKNPCKSYKTEAAAEKATAEAAQNVANYFTRGAGEGKGIQAKSANYIIIYIESWGRWVGFINLSEVLARSDSTGGYLGIEPGFYKW